MTHWIETEREVMVNLAHVMTAEPHARDKYGIPWTEHILTLVNGSRHVTRGRATREAGLDWSGLFATILPALPGQTAWIVNAYADGEDDEARPNKVWAREYPILGWRVQSSPHDFPLPIVPVITAGSEVMPVMPDRRIVSYQWEDEYDNYDEMVAAVLTRAQGRWDARNAVDRPSGGEAVGADR